MPVPNSGFRHRDQITPREAGQTVLAHLTVRYPRATEAEWQGRIAAGQVRLGDQPVAGDELLRAGECLVWDRPPWIEPEVPLATAVLYEDQALLAVAKPSGLPTLPGGGEFLKHPEESCVLDWISSTIFGYMELWQRRV